MYRHFRPCPTHPRQRPLSIYPPPPPPQKKPINTPGYRFWQNAQEAQGGYSIWGGTKFGGTNSGWGHVARLFCLVFEFPFLLAAWNIQILNLIWNEGRWTLVLTTFLMNLLRHRLSNVTPTEAMTLTFEVVPKLKPDFVHVPFACRRLRGGIDFGKMPNKPRGVLNLGGGTKLWGGY